MSLKYHRRSRFFWEAMCKPNGGRSFVLVSKSSFRLCYLSQELVEFDLFVEFLFLLVVFSHTVWMSRVYCVPLDLVSLSLCASLYDLWDLSMSHVLVASWKSWTEIALSPLFICSSRSTTAITTHFVIWNRCRFSGKSVKVQYVAWCRGRSVQYGRWGSRSTGEETISGLSQHVRIPTNNRFKILIPCSSKLDSM